MIIQQREIWLTLSNNRSKEEWRNKEKLRKRRNEKIKKRKKKVKIIKKT